jgi:hypothetical protein
MLAHDLILQLYKLLEFMKIVDFCLFLFIIVLQVLSLREFTMENEDWVVIMRIIVILIEALWHGGNIWKCLHPISLMTTPMCNLSSRLLLCTICSWQVLYLHLDQILAIGLSCIVPSYSCFYWPNMMINGGLKILKCWRRCYSRL